MITPRTTRLVRVPDLQAFREAVVRPACDGGALDARDRLVIVPTHAAAAHLLRSMEGSALTGRGALAIPDLVTPAELIERLAERLPQPAPRLTTAEREVLLGVAARSARDAGQEPPFRLRPALVAEMLRFYDALRLNGKDVDTFERLALGMLEPGASYDRGADRLVRQTRFLAAAFRDFERRSGAEGVDPHHMRHEVLTTAASRPYRHVVVTVADAAFDPYGLLPAQWDLLARLPGLERLDVIVTDTMLAGALHERVHQLLPGLDEVRADVEETRPLPALVATAGKGAVHISRDREEEVAAFARRVKQMARGGTLPSLDRAALVVKQPLPYVYVAREVLRSGGVPCQLFDTLPLAAEPYAAALDLVLSFVSSGFGRLPAIALLRSPHFRFAQPPAAESRSEAGLSGRDVAALDRALAEAGYSGGIDVLERLVSAWSERVDARPERARAACAALLDIARALASLRTDAAAAAQLATLRDFLVAHERLPSASDSLRARHLRARAAVLGTIETLRAAYERFDARPTPFDDVGALLRRWIEGQTFAPRSGERGVHVVDAESARFGAFDLVQIAGLVEGEWPDRPRRNIFYSTSILRELGWPAEADRVDGARAAFRDLLRLPRRWLVASAFALESDAIVSPSPFVEDVEHAPLERAGLEDSHVRIFEHEALLLDPPDARPLSRYAQSWLARRQVVRALSDARYRGMTRPHAPPVFSLGALERYQDCPFKFFAADVLRLQEAPSDESTTSPRARGRFVHEVFQAFFATWDRDVGGAITPANLDKARHVFVGAAEPLLSRLPESEAALERTRLFGSAISLGIADIVLGLEAARPGEIQERLLEHRFEGTFELGGTDRRRVALRGVADRIDLLSGRRLRVIDYKTGSAPNPRRALQVPVYALCAQEQLGARDGTPWTVQDAAYVAFRGRRPLVSVMKSTADGQPALAAARSRLFEAVEGVGRGEFPPRPHDPMICRSCSYSTVCRKDYADDD